MEVPVGVALQGTDVINKYLGNQDKIRVLEKDVALNSNDEYRHIRLIREIVENSSLYSDVTKMSSAIKLEGLVKNLRKIQFKIIDIHREIEKIHLENEKIKNNRSESK